MGSLSGINVSVEDKVKKCQDCNKVFSEHLKKCLYCNGEKILEKVLDKVDLDRGYI